MESVNKNAQILLLLEQALKPITGLLSEIGELFKNAGFEISLVGGPVRDALLGKAVKDLDFTTNARADEIQKILKPWAENIWDVGIKFGTVGAKKNDFSLEITTYRSEVYDPSSRKPEVNFGNSLLEDLTRRDFTINAIALKLPEFEIVDPHNGVNDLINQKLKAPIDPEILFSEDPLRMLRAARFISKLDLVVDKNIIEAVEKLKSRLSVVSRERISDEFSKLLLLESPRKGLEFLVQTKLAEEFLPELPALQLEVDEHHRHKDVYHHTLIVLEQAIDLEKSHEPQLAPDLVLRIAALLHDIGKPKTRKFEAGGRVSFHHHEVVGARMAKKRLHELRFSKEIINDVSKLVELHLRFHGFGSGLWTDSAVRRYVRDAGDQLLRLHKLTRADSTTRNQKKADELQKNYDKLEERISELSKEEELAKIRPDLNGQEIMEILNLPPGPLVGKAYEYLLEIRIEQGPQTKEVAKANLLIWWQNQES
ncbi:MAG: CCA tRNA nucleotidyltransferase [Candidatus Nanopelagicales bacterium]